MTDRFLYCTSGNSSGITGGAENHNHEYKFRYTLYNDNIGGYTHTGSDSNGNYGGFGSYDYNKNTYVANRQVGTSPSNITMTHDGVTSSSWQMENVGNTSYKSNLPPYITVYAWQRTA